MHVIVHCSVYNIAQQLIELQHQSLRSDVLNYFKLLLQSFTGSALAALVKGLPEALQRQYEYEDPIVRGGKQLLHSPFFKVCKYITYIAIQTHTVYNMDILWFLCNLLLTLTFFLGVGSSSLRSRA